MRIMSISKSDCFPVLQLFSLLQKKKTAHCNQPKKENYVLMSLLCPGINSTSQTHVFLSPTEYILGTPNLTERSFLSKSPKHHCQFACKYSALHSCLVEPCWSTNVNLPLFSIFTPLFMKITLFNFTNSVI